jgi:uncharacterized protein YndB with AHSA1/START domain
MQDNKPIVIERTFDAPVDVIWQAITDKNEMKKWYFDLAEFRPQVGFEFKFMAGDDNKQWLHLCKVTEVQPGKKLSYSWRYDGHPGNSLVSFELFPQGDQTTVRLTHSGLETFPADIPEFRKENFVAGWTEIIGKSLKEYLEKEMVK